MINSLIISRPSPTNIRMLVVPLAIGVIIQALGMWITYLLLKDTLIIPIVWYLLTVFKIIPYVRTKYVFSLMVFSRKPTYMEKNLIYVFINKTY